MPDDRPPGQDASSSAQEGGPEARLQLAEARLEIDERLAEETLQDRLADEAEGAVGTTEGATAVVTATAGGLAVERPGSLWGDAWRELRRSPLFLISAAMIVLLVMVAAFPGLFTGADPRACDITRSLLRPSGEHWFGTDLQGCDYFARVLYGARVSIVVGGLVAGSAAVVAVVFGTLAGYYGGLTDAIIARITDIWFGVPYVLGAIVVLTVLRARGLFQITLVLALLFWPTMLRLMRGSVLSAKAHDYVMAARALGASDLRIMARHILPNATAPVIVYATITVGIAVATEATLSYLGVGLQLPAISWGLMISEAQNRILQAPHLLLFPGLFLSVTVFSFVLLGDALRDALDPRLR
jgi:oligopeptide transport system permease protein